MKTVRVLKDVFISTLPLAAIIIVVCVFIAPLADAAGYIKLAVGYAGVVVGQTMFLVGLETSILPIGKLVGRSMARYKRLSLILLTGLLFGFLATVAEPALTVLARQTHMILPIVDETLFLWVMSGGVGIFVAFALYRIVKDYDIRWVFIGCYAVVFLMVILAPSEFTALAFDGSGATTGDISVPFILTMGMGVAATLSKHKTNDDTFGLIGLASVGPILAILVYGLILRAAAGDSALVAQAYNPGAAEDLAGIIVSNLGGVSLALYPVVFLSLPIQIFVTRTPLKRVLGYLLGTIPVFLGLLIFLSAIDFGFAFAGKYIGEVFLDPSRPGWFRWVLLLVSFILGAAITLSEPAVTVLGDQLEEITNGHIRKTTIRVTLAIGIGVAAVLAIIKIISQVNLFWFLVPLYALAIMMVKFTPKLFVGLAFDSGGVTGGALSSAFLTPLTLGASQAAAAAGGSDAQSVLTNGFGILAFISVTPLIAIQLAGIVYQYRVSKAQKLTALEERAEMEDLAAVNSEGAGIDVGELPDGKTDGFMQLEGTGDGSRS